MLTKDDELLCHQFASTFDHVEPSDPKWTERIVVYVVSGSGTIGTIK